MAAAWSVTFVHPDLSSGTTIFLLQVGRNNVGFGASPLLGRTFGASPLLGRICVASPLQGRFGPLGEAVALARRLPKVTAGLRLPARVLLSWSPLSWRRIKPQCHCCCPLGFGGLGRLEAVSLFCKWLRNQSAVRVIYCLVSELFVLCFVFLRISGPRLDPLNHLAWFSCVYLGRVRIFEASCLVVLRISGPCSDL